VQREDWRLRNLKDTGGRYEAMVLIGAYFYLVAALAEAWLVQYYNVTPMRVRECHAERAQIGGP